ncbi:hypothetical protein N657DRAFT_649723 [Parathielavia appendiculata]|uniref:Subtelomeric hrmA-associated cluster protein AFUB-079030/YDR124W-like helical bundle domain-containing protein n=1 Tax=Parathielavia appendiculata TaxID=2587402 RepID=A0AAN6YZG7_9PEZI|nr:hypothetical protein N657DRAFT_649723 [Parathielavia appendiculata]
MSRLHMDDDAPCVISWSKVSLVIGDDMAVFGFYKQRLKSIPQTACEEIAKAFVKLMAPNLYTGSDSSAPGWWPKDRVRYIDPADQSDEARPSSSLYPEIGQQEPTSRHQGAGYRHRETEDRRHRLRVAFGFLRRY